MHVNPRIATLLGELNHPSLPGIDLSLERMWQLLAALGNPQKKLPPVIHVAGTNGKGSTIAFLRAIYEASGRRVHCYTSPHLVRFNERIVVAGNEITDEALLALLEQVAAHAKAIPVTFFEATTAAALLAFAESAAEVVLLETGLGGRLDATNVVANPIATVITPVDYDHMEFLGGSLAAIAAEKAGITKPDVPCITVPQKPEVMEVLAQTAQVQSAPLLICDEAQLLTVPALTGAHQRQNAALAALVARHCGIDAEAIAQGISTARWPARLQPLTRGPLVDAWAGELFLDGGHNAHAAAALAQWLAARPTPTTLVCGMMARKDAQGFLQPLAPYIDEIITLAIPNHADSYTAAALAAQAQACGIRRVTSCMSLEAVCRHASRGANATLLIAGSLFLAGEILKNHG